MLLQAVEDVGALQRAVAQEIAQEAVDGERERGREQGVEEAAMDAFAQADELMPRSANINKSAVT